MNTPQVRFPSEGPVVPIEPDWARPTPGREGLAASSWMRLWTLQVGSCLHIPEAHATQLVSSKTRKGEAGDRVGATVRSLLLSSLQTPHLAAGGLIVS